MKMRRILTSILLLTLVMALFSVRIARAATITVTTNNDVLDAAANCAAVTVASLPGTDGVTSLREAICAANNNIGADTINFNIPGAGVQTINLLSALPQLADDDDPTKIDGYTQFGAAPATNATPATILIEINGTGILNNGLNITSSGNEIRGLAIYGFVGSGIYIANYAGSIANDNVVAGNYIGVNAGGVLCLGNGLNGVFVGAGAQNNLIGGDSPADRNLISCNGWEGVGIHGSGTTGNAVSGNYIGIDPLGTTSQGNTLDGVRIYGGAQNNTIGGDTPGERNVISGNDEDGVCIYGEGTTGNIVSGNYIGTDVSGAANDLGNQGYGVSIAHGAQNNTIGPDNVISSNDKNGVLILDDSTTGNTVSGNYIGTDESGTEALGNGGHGVSISSAHNSIIGGDTEGERNVISGNGKDGVKIINGATGNVVSGNYIGVDATGATALPNQDDGVDIFLGSDNLIGGDTPGERNVISGNVEDGVRIAHRATANVVSGNYIGVDASGTAIIPNNRHGVYIDSGARDNIVGGHAEGERNVISGNGNAGVWIGGDQPEITSGNSVLGNYIGLAIDGVTSLGNERNGIRISLNGHNNTIGPGNMIAHNGDDGIGMYTATAFGNTITKNSIFSNADLGIGLTNGANNGMPAPTILTAPSGPGDITGAAFPGSTVELFASHDADGEGEVFLGSASAGPAGDYVLTVSSLPYAYLTATATDPTDGTSEFSAVFTAPLPVLDTSTKTVDRATASPGEVLTYTITLVNNGTAAATAQVTDTLPSEVTWANNYSVSAGTLTWDDPNNRLLWSGTVDVGTPVTIVYQVTVNGGVSDDTLISNTATVNDGAGNVSEIGPATVTVIAHYLYLPLVLR